MKKFLSILFSLLLALTTVIAISGCDTNDTKDTSDTNSYNDSNVETSAYLEDTLSLIKYKKYLTITSTYSSKTNAFNNYMLDVTYSVTITPNDNSLIFENCFIVIDGKRITIQATGITSYQFTTTKSSFSEDISLRNPSEISGKVKRPNDGTYKIYYLDLDDNIINYQSIKQGKSINEAYIPNLNNGYKFIAWSLNGHDVSASVYLKYPYTPTKDIWLYCVAEAKIIPITLVNDKDVSTSNIVFGDNYNLYIPTKKTRKSWFDTETDTYRVELVDDENYEFVGWFSTESGNGVQYTDKNGNSLFPYQLEVPITLYARWQIKKTDKEWDNLNYYSLDYYNIKNAKVSYYNPNYFYIDAEPGTTYKVTTSTNYLNMNSYVSIRIAAAMGALLEGGSFVNYSFGKDIYSCPTFTFEVSQAGRYYIAVLGYGLQSTPNLDYIYNIFCQIIY